jgi:hypothetical protein
LGGLVVAIALAASGCGGFNEPALQPITKEPPTSVVIPPVKGQTAAFDYLAIDQDAHRLYISDLLDHGVDVVDVSSSPGRYLQTISLGANPGTSTPRNPQGITFASDPPRLFTANDDGTVSIIDANTASSPQYAVLANIKTSDSGTADLLDYDPQDHKLYVGNPDDGFVSAIDVNKDVVVSQIPKLGIVAQPRYNPADRMLYVVSGDSNSIFQIDPRKDAVVRQYTLPIKCIPHGLAINPATNQGLIGCDEKDFPVTIAWDFALQRFAGSFDLTGGSDQTIFDPKSQHFYVASPGYAPAEVAVFNGGPIRFLSAVPTSHRSNGVAYDEAHQMIYTYDSRHLEAAVWEFPDPVAGCHGTEAQRAADGAPLEQTPNCHPGSQRVSGR